MGKWWIAESVRRNKTRIVLHNFMENNLVTDSEVIKWAHQLESDYVGVMDSGQAQLRRPMWVSWKMPKIGVAKLNVNNSVHGSLSRAGFGGIFRDHGGSWLVGFNGSIGEANILLTELSALKHGLQIA